MITNLDPVTRLRPHLAREGALALLVALASLLLYLPTLSPSVVGADGGELQMLAPHLGVPHPTGYPLFMLLSWLFTLLPVGNIAYRVTLFCTVTAAAAIGLFYLLLRELGVSRVVAVAGAALLATVPRLWMHAAAAEVYPLSIFFILLVLWLLLRWGAGRSPLWLVALAFGFGLTHHISLRLLAPAAALYALAVAPRLPLQPRRWLPALVMLLLPLALYLYIPLRAAHFDGLPELEGTVLSIRKTVASGLVSPHYYAGGATNLILALNYSQRFFGDSGITFPVLVQYFGMTREQFPLLVLPLALAGLLLLLRRQPRASLLLLLAYGLTTFAALRFLASVGEDGDHFIPAYILTIAWFSIGADALVEWGRRYLPAGRVGRLLLLALLWLLPLANLALQFPRAMERRQIGAGEEARGLLAPLPEGAVVAGEWSRITPLLYVQRVEGVRPDLWVMHADGPGITRLMGEALQEKHPFFALRPTVAGTRLLPLPLYDEDQIDHPANERLGRQVRWRGYSLPAHPLHPGDPLPLTLYWQSEAPIEGEWNSFIHLLDGQGQVVAQIDRVPVGGFYPPRLWQPGLLLADQYELSLPATLAPGSYRLIFGWYNSQERLIWEDGQNFQELATIELLPR